MLIAQLILNGAMAGSIISVAAIAFNIIFAVLRISNFSLAAHMAVGAYAGWVANSVWGLPAVGAVLCAFVVAGVMGVASDYVALRPLRGYGPISVAIASMAVNMVVENIVRFGFGNDVRSLDIPARRDWVLGGLRIGPQQFFDFLIAAVAMVALFGLLRFTRIGRAMRAVADNPRLADIKGIDPERISRLAVFIGMGLGGIAGLLIALDSAVDPTMGMRVILSVFAAAVVGGLGNVSGAVVGGLMIGVAEEVSSLVLPVDYRSAVGFAAIIVAMLFFPRGILGDR